VLILVEDIECSSAATERSDLGGLDGHCRAKSRAFEWTVRRMNG
jgi:hypothetical protein